MCKNKGNAMNAFTIRKKVKIDAINEKVFNALTSSNEIVKYFPLKEVTSEWHVGEEITFKGEIDGKEFTDYGVIEVLNRPSEFKYSYWSDNHETERTPENHLTIRYTLISSSQGTTLELEQSNLKSEEMFRMMDRVWDSLLNSLKQYAEHRT